MSTPQSPAVSGLEPMTALLIKTGFSDTLAQFNPSLHQLRLIRQAQADEKIDLGFSGSKLLERLLLVPGDVVSREELIAFAWPERVVGQGSLNQQIYTLRQILGDEKDREIIQTLPRRGYLFNPERLLPKAAPIELATIAEASPAALPSPTPAAKPKYWPWALGAALLASCMLGISVLNTPKSEKRFAPLEVVFLNPQHEAMLTELAPTLKRMSTLTEHARTIALAKAGGFYQLHCLKPEHSYRLQVHPAQLNHLADAQLQECLQ